MMTVQIANRTCEVVASDPTTAAFWRRVDAANWEEDTFRFIDRAAFLRRHPITLVDIGAAVGAVSLYASARVDQVLAIEPEPVAFAQLAANAQANTGNITTWNVALDERPGILVVFPTNGGPLSEDLQGVTARAITFADIDAAIDPATSVVVKMDIEGHEYRVLDALLAFSARRRAPIHLSLHPRAVHIALAGLPRNEGRAGKDAGDRNGAAVRHRIAYDVAAPVQADLSQEAPEEFRGDGVAHRLEGAVDDKRERAIVLRVGLVGAMHPHLIDRHDLRPRLQCGAWGDQAGLFDARPVRTRNRPSSIARSAQYLFQSPPTPNLRRRPRETGPSGRVLTLARTRFSL